MSFKNVHFGNTQEFNVIIEIPKGSEVKYEYNETTDQIQLDWIFTDGFNFPFNYGFIPETKSGDGDNLDVFILNNQPLAIGIVTVCRAIGMIELLDRGEEDNKILAVPINDPLSKKLNSIKDLPENYFDIFKKFFKELGIQKNKKLEIKGFHDKIKAIEEIELCNKRYNKKT
ncbi:MAG: inorganic diphosphatase [Nanoarchaeota archaeon]